MTLFYRCRLCAELVHVPAPEVSDILRAPAVRTHRCKFYGNTGVLDIAGAKAEPTKGDQT